LAATVLFLLLLVLLGLGVGRFSESGPGLLITQVSKVSLEGVTH